MSSKQSKDAEDDNSKKEASLDSFSLDIEASHLIRDVPRSKHARFIERIEVKPREQPRIFLGNFTADDPPKGFSVEFSPDPNPKGSVVTQVITIGTSKRYRLVLHIANYGNKAITAEVWQL